MKHFKLFYLLIALMASLLTCISQRAYAYDDHYTIDFKINRSSVNDDGIPLTETGLLDALENDEGYVSQFSSISNASYFAGRTISDQRVGGIKLGEDANHGGSFTIDLSADGQVYVESIDIVASVYKDNTTFVLTVSASDASGNATIDQTKEAVNNVHIVRSFNANAYSATHKTSKITISSDRYCFIEEVHIYYNYYPSGSCGDNLTWVLQNGVLTISGTGAMTAFSNSDAVPWKDYKVTMTSVSLPEGLTTIGNYAFYDCTNLTSINIPAGVTSIGGYAFSGCAGLTSITIPANVTSIGECAFSECTGLNYIDIPASVTSIGDNAFLQCTALAYITIDSNNTVFDSRNDCNAIIETSSNKLFVGGIKTVIPNSVTSIGDYAFFRHSGLTSISIPSSVTSIGDYAFAYCTNLREVYVNWNTPPTPGTFAFRYLAAVATLHVPYGTSANYTGASWSGFANIVEMNPTGQCGDNLFWEYDLAGTLTITGTGAMTDYASSSATPWYAYKGVITSVNLPVGLTSIGGYAFSECTGLNYIDIPASVTSIGNSAFSQCDKLSVNFASGSALTTIKKSAFNGCSGLTSITIPEGLETIGETAFNGCTGLTSIDIPSSVTSIGKSAFLNCSGLTSITVNDGNTVFDSRDNCNAIIASSADSLILGCKNTTIPNTVTIIGYRAFQGCTGLTSIDLPSSVTTIDERAFSGCTGLTEVEIPSSVTSIGKSAFQGCSGLTSLTISEGVTMDNERIFQNCSSLTSVTIPSSMTAIPDYTFASCTGLQSVTIPNSVTSINKYAFQNCSTLVSITIPSNVNTIGTRVFENCTGLTDIYVSWISTPTVPGLNPFLNVETSAITLHVPVGTYDTYQSTSPWSSFNIVADIPSGQCGDNLFWEYNPSTTTLTITGTGAMADYAIINSMPWSAFKTDITSVVLPEGLTSIGDYAFYGCTALTTINIPNSVTSIEYSAFQYCSALTSINIPEQVEIGKHAFYSSGLNTLEINNSGQISESAFASCFSLTEVTITVADTKDIKSSVFKNCTNLTTVTLDASKVPQEAFMLCENLTTVNLGNRVETIDGYAFQYCTALTSINIPSGVTSIGSWAFSNCSSLETIDFPASVTSIRTNAFLGCTGLKDVMVHWDTPTPSANAFSSVTLANVNLHLPFEAWGNYENAYTWKSFKQVPVITAKADPENDGVFYNTFYHSSKAYVLPANVEAYTAKRNGSDLILTKIAQAGDVLPANTAVILKSSVEQFEMTPSDASTAPIDENDLQGVDAATAAPENCYVLSGKASDNSVTGVGFYQFSGTLGAHKAYMVVSGGAGAPKRLRFVFDAATGVESLVRPASDVSIQKVMRDGQLIIIRNGVEYNINGQMVK